MSAHAIRDEGIYAFNPVPAVPLPPPRPPPRPPRRFRLWVPAGLAALVVLVVLAVLVVLGAISGATAIAALIDGAWDTARDGVHVVVNGENWAGGHLSVGHGLLAGLGRCWR